MHCSGVEWNGCILGHFGHCGSFCALLVIFDYCLTPKTQNRRKKYAFQRSVSDYFKKNKLFGFVVFCPAKNALNSTRDNS